MATKKKDKKKSNIKEIIKWISIITLTIVAYFVYILFAPNISPKTGDKAYLCIPDNSSFKDVANLLDKNASVTNFPAFDQVAGLFHYGKKIRSGRYELKKGMSNFQLVRILRNGRQTPVRLTFNNIRTKEQLAARLGKQLMADSVSILKLLNDTAFLTPYGLTPNTSIALFIPNTYEVFWNINEIGRAHV